MRLESSADVLLSWKRQCLTVSMSQSRKNSWITWSNLKKSSIVRVAGLNGLKGRGLRAYLANPAVFLTASRMFLLSLSRLVSHFWVLMFAITRRVHSRPSLTSSLRKLCRCASLIAMLTLVDPAPGAVASKPQYSSYRHQARDSGTGSKQGDNTSTTRPNDWIDVFNTRWNHFASRTVSVDDEPLDGIPALLDGMEGGGVRGEFPSLILPVV